MDFNQISEMIDRVRKLKNEELKGNQHKIDANKNGKVDAHDFKLLRKMKKEEVEQIDELSKNTLKSYKYKAGQDARAHDSASLKAFKQGDKEKDDAHFNKSVKRMAGVSKAIDKLLKKGVAEGKNIGGERYDVIADLKGRTVNELNKLIQKLEGIVANYPDHSRTNEYLGLAKMIRAQKIGKKGVAEEVEEISERRSDREIALSDSPRRRSFGYDSHGYSLRPGHDEGKPVRDRNYGSSYSGPSDSAKIYHKVPFTQRDAAKAEGMKWDSGAKKWYHSSSTKSNQSKFEKS